MTFAAGDKLVVLAEDESEEAVASERVAA